MYPYPEGFREKVAALHLYFVRMSEAVERQGAGNADLVYYFRDTLEKVLESVDKQEPIGPALLKDWNYIMGFAGRFFDGDDILEPIRDVDAVICGPS
jgi:hypothetical protein